MKRGDREVAPFSFQALRTRLLEAGKRSSFSAGRIGRFTSSPPQFGQRSPRAVSAQERQNVHSKEQINASELAAGRSQSQFSQLGRSSSMALGSAQWVIAAVCSPSRAKRNGVKRAFRKEHGAHKAPRKDLLRHAPRCQVETLAAQLITGVLQRIFQLLRVAVGGAGQLAT